MSVPIEVVFRCDFGNETGWGHLVRSSALARAIGSFKIPATLLTTGESQHLPKSITDAFNRIVISPKQFPDENLWKNLLGADSSRKLIVVDHYLYRGKNLMRLRSLGSGLVVIDDEALTDLTGADMIVNPGLAFSQIDYPFGGKVLTGPTYALLRPEFRIRNNKIIAKTAVNPKTVLLMFGGTDAYNLLTFFLEWLSNRVGENWRPVLAGSKESIDRPSVSAVLKRFSSHKCLYDAGPQEIAQAMQDCAYGIAACGGVVYEMAACGLPFLGVVVAGNQKAMGSAIEKKWDLPILRREELSPELMSRKWNSLVEKYPGGSRTDIRGLDGYGALRVAEEILLL